MVGLLFPGQGSQFVGMGRDLVDAFPEAKRTFEEANDALGASLTDVMWDGPVDQLTLTSNAQPAILAHSIAVYRIVQDRFGTPALAAGHSLGEFSAYVAAGSLSFADGVRTVRLRGDLMQRSGLARPGTMAALLGLEDDAVERVCAEATSGTSVCVPANYNSPGQLVISGDVDAIDRALVIAKAAGAKRAIKLNVSGAFHSPLMQVAEQGLGEQLRGTSMRAPAFPIVSNVTARPVTDAETALQLLVEQLTSPVRWTASMQTMLEHGVTHFSELGPGSVLMGLLKRIERSADCRAIGTADDIAGLST